MKITCSKSNLVKGVSIVSKAVPSKTTMPILECILIDATTDIIKLTANDQGPLLKISLPRQPTPDCTLPTFSLFAIYRCVPRSCH